MPLGTITILDGNGVPLTVQMFGTASPFTSAHVLIDGVAGVNAAQVTTGNALKVDGTATVQPVSFPSGVSVTGSVSIIQGVNVAAVSGAGALKVDGTGGTFTVGGTVTANIGTTGGLALESGGNLASIATSFVGQGVALGTNKQVMAAGSVTSAVPVYAAGQISPLSLTTSGLLRVDMSSSAPATVLQGAVNTSLPWIVKITDSTGTNSPAIKTGTGFVVSNSDPALVVAISPNSQNANGPTVAASSSPVTSAIDQYRSYKGVTQTAITVNTETTIVPAGTGHRDIYGLILANNSATATLVTIKDSTAGTTRMVVQVPAGDTRGFMLPVDSAVIQQSAVANNWTATCGTAVTTLNVTALWVNNA